MEVDVDRRSRSRSPDRRAEPESDDDDHAEHTQVLQAAYKRVTEMVACVDVPIDTRTSTVEEIRKEVRHKLDFNTEVQFWTQFRMNRKAKANGLAISQRECVGHILRDLQEFFTPTTFPVLPVNDQAYRRRLGRTDFGKLAKQIRKIGETTLPWDISTLILEVRTRKLEEQSVEEQLRRRRSDALGVAMLEEHDAAAQARIKARTIMLEKNPDHGFFNMNDPRPSPAELAQAKPRPKYVNEVPCPVAAIRSIWGDISCCKDHVPECIHETRQLLEVLDDSGRTKVAAELERLGDAAASREAVDVAAELYSEAAASSPSKVRQLSLRVSAALASGKLDMALSAFRALCELLVRVHGRTGDETKQAINLLVSSGPRLVGAVEHDTGVALLTMGRDLCRWAGDSAHEADFGRWLLATAEEFAVGTKVEIYNHPLVHLVQREVFTVVWCKVKHAGLSRSTTFSSAEFTMDTKYLRRIS